MLFRCAHAPRAHARALSGTPPGRSRRNPAPSASCLKNRRGPRASTTRPRHRCDAAQATAGIAGRALGRGPHGPRRSGGQVAWPSPQAGPCDSWDSEEPHCPESPGPAPSSRMDLGNFSTPTAPPPPPGPATRRSRPGPRRRRTCAAPARAPMKTNDAVSEWLRALPRMLETWVRVPAR